MPLHKKIEKTFLGILFVLNLWFIGMNIGSAVIACKWVRSYQVVVATTIIASILSMPASLVNILFLESPDYHRWQKRLLFSMFLIPILNFLSVIVVVSKYFVEIVGKCPVGINNIEEEEEVIYEDFTASIAASCAFGMLFFSILYLLWSLFILWGITDMVGAKRSMETFVRIWSLLVTEILLLMCGIGMLVFGYYCAHRGLLIGGSVVVGTMGIYIIAIIFVFIRGHCHI